MLAKSLATSLPALKLQPTVRSFHAASTLFSGYPVGKNGKPLGPYMRFCHETRPKLASNKELKATEIISELGRLWRALPDSERLRYKEEYQAEVKK